MARSGTGTGPDPDGVIRLGDLARELDLLRCRAAAGTGKARVSLSKLAERVRLPKSTVHTYVAGRTLAPADVLDRIVIALGATPAEQTRWGEAWFRLAAWQHEQRQSARPVPRQLPLDIAAFTGRHGDLEMLDQLLTGIGPAAAPAVVISAIAGTAGVGKTALAVHWAWRVADRFPDGQLYLNLRGYSDRPPVPPEDALAMLLRELGVNGHEVPQTLEERVNRYRTRTAGRRMLIILDNANSAEQVRDLLPGDPTCFVVITSRDSLAGLVARDGAYRIDLDLLPEAEAIALVRELIGGRVAAEPEAAARLVRLCARLPLALRIAAEFVRGRPLRTLASVIDELADEHRRLDLLDAGGDTQTSVRTVLAWSFRDLPAPVASTFRLLGCHPGLSFDEYAVAAVSGIDVPVARRHLDALVRAHLIENRGGGRYGMHDLLRVYARELAQSAPDAERNAATFRLLEHFLAATGVAVDQAYPAHRHQRPAVPPAGSALPPAADTDGLAWLGTELHTIVAITELAAGNGFPSHAMLFASILTQYLDSTAQWSQAAAIHGAALSAARAANDQGGQAVALRSLGFVSHNLGRYEEAIERYELSVATLRCTGDDRNLANTLNRMGITLQAIGRLTDALCCYRQVYEIRSGLTDRLGIAQVLVNISIVEQLRGELHQARLRLEHALGVFRELGDRVGAGYALCNLAEVSRASGEYRQAIDQHRQAIDMFRHAGGRIGEVISLDGLGSALAELGDLDAAADQHREALAVANRTGLSSLVPRILNSTGRTLALDGRHQDALASHRSALAAAHSIGNCIEQARALRGLGCAMSNLDHPDAARDYLTQAHTIFTELGLAEADQVRADLSKLD